MVLVGLLLMTVPLRDLRATLLGIRLGPLVAVVAAHAAILVVRVRRWEWIVSTPARPVPSRAAWDAVFVGWFANFALPAKLGELARPWVYAQATGRPFTELLATVALERVLDLLALGALFWLAFAVLPGAEGVPLWFGRLATVGGVASVGGLLALAALRRFGPTEGAVGRFRAGLDLFGRPAVLLRVLAITGAIWVAEVGAMVLTLVACGAVEPEGLVRIAASASQVVVSTLAVAMPAAPGGIGVDQWATILSLRPFGVADASATAVSLVDMAAVMAWVVPIGLFAFLRRGGGDLARSMAEGADGTIPP